jgi:hypothetical protein
MAVSVTNRRINSTGRSRITRSAVFAKLEAENGEARLSVDLDLTQLPSMPPSAAVRVDAYRKGEVETFSLGTVAGLNPLQAQLLRRFGDPDGVLLRIKIVSTDANDEGRLLAFGDQLKPTSPKDAESTKKAILPFRGDDTLGQEIWRLSLDAEGPVVLMNSGLPSWNTTARSPQFILLVYPEVMRKISRWVAAARRDGETVDSAGTSMSDWMRFVMGLGIDLFEVDGDSDDEDLDKFANKCAEKFSNKYRLLERFKDLVERES